MADSAQCLDGPLPPARSGQSKASLGHIRAMPGPIGRNQETARAAADAADHARALASVMDNLEGIEEINFVAHSLGNLVIRHFLADATDPESGRSPDPRIKRIVMLAPPNHGSARARSSESARTPTERLVWPSDPAGFVGAAACLPRFAALRPKKRPKKGDSLLGP